MDIKTEKDVNEMKATIKFENSYLDLLIDLIINNAELSYTKDSLRVGNDDTIMQVLKIIAEQKYENKLEDLINKDIEKNTLSVPKTDLDLR